MFYRRFLLFLTIAGALLETVNPVAAQTWTPRYVPAATNQAPESAGDTWFLNSVACSADGTTIVAAASYGGFDYRPAGIYISTNLGITWEAANLPPSNWTTVTCSSDGTKMVAGAGRYITDPNSGETSFNTVTLYTSSDSGVTWTPQNSTPVVGADYVDGWNSIASSADGTKLVAAVNEFQTDAGPTNSSAVAGGIYLSSDSGASWHAAGGIVDMTIWNLVASSADGNTLAAVGANVPPPGVGSGPNVVYVSTDGGGSFQPANLPDQPFLSVAISGDGRTMVAAYTNIFTSTNSGVTWLQQPGTPQGEFDPFFWKCLAVSADGTKMVAGVNAAGPIYTSVDSGMSWWLTNGLVGSGWMALASSADGNEVVALPRRVQGGGNKFGFDMETLQAPLVAKISATPQVVQLSNTISVVVTVINNSDVSVANAQVNGSINVAGTGGVSSAGFSGPTVALTLAPGASASFTYLYTATNYGTVNFTAAAICTGPGGALTTPLATSANVNIAPKADLLIKTSATNDLTFLGGDEFQQTPSGDQILTIPVASNSMASYIVRFQNDTQTTRTFALHGVTNSVLNWSVQVLQGGVSIFDSLISSTGWTTPMLAPGASLDMQVSIGPLVGAGVLDRKSLLITAVPYSANTTVLDAVLLYATLVPVPVQATLLSMNEAGLTPSSVQAGTTDINAPLVPVTDPAVLAAQSVIHGGLVADGVTPLVIQLGASPANLAQFPNGLDFALQVSILGGGTLNGNTISQRIEVLTNGAWQPASDVTLTAANPTAYVQVLPILSDDLTFNAQPPELDVDFSIMDTNSGVQAGDVKFALRKPPIALIHGYNTAGQWGDAFKGVLGSSRPLTADAANNFIVTVTYGQDVLSGGVLATVQAYVGMPVYVNTVAPLDNCAQMALQAFQLAMGPLHNEWGFTRFDVVAHSQGGLLTRMLCNANANSYISQPFRNPDNFNRGRFHRIVTIGSPHNGTRLLRYLLDLNNDGKFALYSSIPGIVSALGVWSSTAQAKFDPWGSQIAELNDPSPGALWQPDPAAPFHLVRTVIDNGASPSTDDATESYVALGLSNPFGGSIVLPRGSDGVVDFDAMAANVPPASVGANVYNIPAVNSISHSQPIEVFNANFCQTESTVVAQHVIDALDQSANASPADIVFGSFSVPKLLSDNLKSAIDAYAAALTIQSAAHNLTRFSKQDLQNTYNYQFTFPTNQPPSGDISWYAQVYGPNGISFDELELSVSGTNDNQVTVTVDSGLIGDVVLSGAYTSGTNTVILIPPTLVVSLPTTGPAMTGFQIMPGNIALSVGSVIAPELLVSYSDGSTSFRYPNPGAVTVTSSQPSVSVTNSLAWQLSSVGTSTITVNWNGFQAQDQITVFDPTANIPPTLSAQSTENGQLTVSWPGFTTSYQLQSSAALTATNVWQPIPVMPVSAGGESIVTLSVNNAQQFYRLQLQP